MHITAILLQPAVWLGCIKSDTAAATTHSHSGTCSAG